MQEKIIVGTAAMGRLNSARTIRRFIAECAKAGFTSFDTAPLYGSGMMEAILAEAGANRDFKVNTKFGLQVPRPLAFPGGPYLLKKSALALLKRMPGGSGREAAAEDLLEAAQASLDRSLRLFGKGRIDVFFAHETPLERLMSPAFLDFIRESKCNGSFARFGLGGYRSQYPGVGSGDFWDCVDVLQVESRPGHPFPRPSGWGGSVFLHGVLGGIKTKPPVRALLAEAFGAQAADRVVVGISRESHLSVLSDAVRPAKRD